MDEAQQTAPQSAALLSTIERFVAACQQPALSEPGEEILDLKGGHLSVELRHGNVVLQAWNDRRNLVRKLTGIESETRCKLALRVERFGKKAGSLALLDLKRTDRKAAGLHASRLEFREAFRLFLRREFSSCKLLELSTEPDLEHSLSPAYPRALLRDGSAAWAAIGAGPESNADGVLTFGLIWLDYLRRTHPRLAIQGLVLFLPSGAEKNTCLRLRFLDAGLVSYSVFAYSEEGYARPVDLADYGNTDTRLEPYSRNVATALDGLAARIAAMEGVSCIHGNDGEISFRIHGLEFAKWSDGQLAWGLETKRAATASAWGDIQSLVAELARFRSPQATGRKHPLWLRNPECWLESAVRSQLEKIDPSLCASPVYGQVPAFAAGGRGILDLLAVDRSGRLAVIELKATEDPHLPLQALDYWIRVKWHLDRNEFPRYGYFPGVRILPEPPRLLLVAPALEFHPTNERVLRFFSPQVNVQRLGVGWEWHKELKLVYRM